MRRAAGSGDPEAAYGCLLAPTEVATRLDAVPSSKGDTLAFSRGRRGQPGARRSRCHVGRCGQCSHLEMWRSLEVVKLGCVPFVVFPGERSEFEGVEELVGFWVERAEHGGEGVEGVAGPELELAFGSVVSTRWPPLSR